MHKSIIVVAHALCFQLVRARCERKQSPLVVSDYESEKFDQTRIWVGSLRCALELPETGEREHSGNG